MIEDSRARWYEAGTTHSRVLLCIEDRSERMRMLASAPLFSLWSEVKHELEGAAAEIDSLRAKIAQLESARNGADACTDHRLDR